MEWDVIGIADVAAVTDEYDCLIGPRLDQLRSAAPGLEIPQLSMGLVRLHFGLQADPDRKGQLAVALTTWWAGRDLAGLR